MINSVNLTGRLTKNPEVKVSQSGISICGFTLAVNRSFTDANGERQADFINCVAFKKQAENLQKYMSKGQMVGVTGRLQSRTYDDKDGKRVFVTEVLCDNIVFLETKNSESNQQATSNYAASNQQPRQSYGSRQEENPFSNEKGNVEISDDDLPF